MKAKVILVAMAAVLLASSGQAQVVNRLKNKVENKGEQKAGEAIDNLFNKKKGQNSGNNGNGQNGSGTGSGNNGSGSGNNNPSNNSGGGLVSTPPDVNQNLADAETAYKKLSYGEARYSVQQAMLGVELEIGNTILKSLPETLTGLKKEADADQVTSTGYGWAGLTIHREYSDGKEKELRITIANNSVWMAGVNAYLANGGYAQQNNGEQNWKQTKVKGNRAVIEYDESSGYRLSVPLGQSSLIVYEGVNFATEADLMKSAEALDIESIKKQLGEQ